MNPTAPPAAASITDLAIAELSAVRAPLAPATAAQLGAALRMAGTLHTAEGRDVLDIAVAHPATARRVADDITHLYGYSTAIVHGRRPYPVVVRVHDHADALARQVGLIDPRGRATRGLAGSLLRATPTALTAVWRGAVITRGELSSPRRALLSVVCPTPEAAFALCGIARRIDVPAKAAATDHDGPTRVLVRGHTEIGALLGILGAPTARGRWLADGRAMARPARVGGNPDGFGGANRRRAATTAEVTALRVQRALDILGENIATDLRGAGHLRLAHPGISLDDLARRADPPVSKDTVAGRLRRLLAAADTTAKTRDIPDTYSAVPAELLDW